MSLTAGTIIIATIFLIMGIIVLCAAIAGYNWLLNNSNTSRRLSRRNAQRLYSVIGLLFLSMSIYLICYIL